jgi:hypothetical protein
MEVREVGHPHPGSRQIDPLAVLKEEEAGLDPEGVGETQDQDQRRNQDETPPQKPSGRARIR